ncbi:MAG: tyrosine-type recombinase/integrase [Chloroflexi bacterium]|nr:tyrosine-type recombinase/integrase [Chloroflexota bacterium]
MGQYRASLKAGNRSPKTISWYLATLEQYGSFLQANGLAKSVNELGAKELEAYVLHLQKAVRWQNSPHKEHKSNLSPYSIQGYVRAIKVFFSWATDQGYIESNPLRKFPLPKVPKSLIPVLSPEHLKSLFGALDRSTPLGARNYCILALLLDTGLRISELVNIKMVDFQSMMTYLKVKGKGQKERLVPISKFARKELTHYVKHHRPHLCQGGSVFLFPARSGDRITVNCVQQELRRLAMKAGLIGVKVHPHIFRHTFATMFLGNGGQSLALKEILGHESILTTQKYVHLRPQDLQAQHAQFSPLAELLGK